MRGETTARESIPLSWRTSAYWPWPLVMAAWALVLLIAWTHQQYLLSHDYLLVESGLPWPAALLLFIGPGQRTSSRQVFSFLAGYAAIWTAFAMVAFLGDTLIHRLVAGWSW